MFNGFDKPKDKAKLKMGGKDFCAVYGCSNCRIKKDKLVVKDHVGILRWYRPKTRTDMKMWDKMLNRRGRYKTSMNTAVCSNHFTAGYCSDVCRIPTLYMQGYDQQPSHQDTKKQSSPTDFVTQEAQKHSHVNYNIVSPAPSDHDYVTSSKIISSPNLKTVHVVQRGRYKNTRKKIAKTGKDVIHRSIINEIHNEILLLKEQLKSNKKLLVSDLKESNN